MGDWVIGVDVGGTFTDFSARQLSTGLSVLHKRPSTPHDPSEAILNGLRELQEKAEIAGDDIARFAHGTTVATNALLQRKGPKTGLVTTRGFRDLLEIGRQVRPAIYDLQTDAPPPLVDREHRLEISERIGPKGEAIIELTDAEIDAIVAKLGPMTDVESLAVCLIFSFLNPAHEERIAAALRNAYPDLCVSISSEVHPEFREYERFSTTVINAFLQPEVGRYMDRLSSAIQKVAPKAALGIFQSAGGLMSIEQASRFPVRTALSGPAAGAVGAAAAAGMSGIRNIITLDIGGTSTDVALIQDGKVETSNLRDIAGFRIRLPTVDIHTVGAGGGSIAHLGADGLLKVGPMSAGAVPGPACYARGGDKPTVSDANVVLGRLPARLANGFPIDSDLARTAIEQISKPLDLSLEMAAHGIVSIAASNMARAIRAVTIEKGQDPRGFTLMCFGGAGGLHAADVADILAMRRILVPRAPGILCAEGLIVADLQENYVTTCRCPLDDDLTIIAEAVSRLSDQAEEWLTAQGDDSAFITSRNQTVILDLRYIGQNYELPVEIGTGRHAAKLPLVESLKRAFFRQHEAAYGHHDPDAGVEIVNVRIRATMEFARQAVDAARPLGKARPAATERIWFERTGFVPTPVYDRDGLAEGTRISGPALITQFDTTTLVPPDWTLSVDAAMNMIMERNDD
ncbi:hydantoinase/oxoprolinase family protein [Paracoccus onubensis]|uniref:hydantoinase/oxoprolinase family protein n=1 Tax=Paracoccus onubensis TaxID=1675788 RepID=UPI00272F0EB7|nr:hydantoinase/oxoprolinase family protein [Paracoccus onubensis]MDP0926709.1 hydantoinase/oxoprolinase family protein [Paracoccus onubensis]